MSLPRKNRPKRRLDRDDWLGAAMIVLPEHGAGALKAEPMSRHMQTTKGSFYWHFRDVPDFHAQILARWETGAMAAADAAATEAGSAPERLRALAQALADPGPERAAEAAIRAWAATDPGARDTLGRIDAARRAALRGLLHETGISNPEMAQIIHAAAVGMALLDDTGTEARRAAIGSLVDLVLALR